MTVHNSPLEQFTLLAKSTRGAAAVELIKQALEVSAISRARPLKYHQFCQAPGVFVFGELLDCENIQVQLAMFAQGTFLLGVEQALENTEYGPFLNLLNVFAYGTFTSLIQNSQNLPQVF